MDPIELKHRFMYHPPTPDQIPVYEEIRAAYRTLAETLDRLVPEGREKAVAFTHIETAQFWSNAGVARYK